MPAWGGVASGWGMTQVAVLIPAAGAAARMRGADKLMQPVDGVALIARQTGLACGLGLPVLVTLRADRPARLAALAGLGAETEIIDTPDEGLAASVRAGAAWALRLAESRGPVALMVLLADLPDLQAADLAALVRLARLPENAGRILRATAADGTPGHPVIWPMRLLPALLGLRGDMGGRDLLQAGRDQTLFVPLAGQRATTDLDTPEAWADWRAARGESDLPPPA